jgi:hypothetical protein
METRRTVVHALRSPLLKSSEVIGAAETTDVGRTAPTPVTANDTPMSAANDLRNIRIISRLDFSTAESSQRARYVLIRNAMIAGT